MNNEEYFKKKEFLKAWLAENGVTWPECGFDVGEGWKPVVLHALMEMLEAGWGGKLDQVKEKFGGLRIYFSCESDQYKVLSEIVTKAEITCSKLCESCGNPHNIKYLTWNQALCEDCKKK